MLEIVIYTLLITVIVFAAYKIVTIRLRGGDVLHIPSSPKEPKELINFTREELAKFDGKDETTPIYISIKGKVYDVSPSRHFYGNGASYSVFAGREAARGLAKMSTDFVDVENSSISDLNDEEIECLNDWIEKFDMKYNIVGFLKD